jgi:hypothetical protein
MTTKQTAINKKIIAVTVIVIIAVASVAGAVYIFNKPANPTLPSMSLTLIGSSGQQRVLTETDIAALTPIVEKGGLKTSGGAISGVATYTGVSVTELLDLVGGMTDSQTLTVTSSDGYKMEYTYNQVNGEDFPTYDPTTASEATVTQPLKMVLVYYKDGALLDTGYGPLRLAILGSEGLLTDGSWWAKMVIKLQVTEIVQDWSVKVAATSNLTLTTDSYNTLLNTYGINYTDSSSNVWMGIGLWHLIDWCVSNGGVTSSALNNGYSVKIISGDATSATFNGSQVESNDNVTLAGMLNGEILPNTYWPLSLVGKDVPGSGIVKNIVEIQINTSSTTPQPTPSPTPVPVDWKLLINGVVAVNMTREQFESQVSSHMQTYDDSGTNMSGIALNQIVSWATSNGVINSSDLNGGYVVKVIGTGGSLKIFNDTRTNSTNNVIIANKANSTYLANSSFPLTVTGTGVAANEKIVCISQIQIIPFPHIELTLVASNGTQLKLFANDLLELPSYTADGGTHSSGGSLGNFGTYTGVPILVLCNLVGGVSGGNSVNVTGSGNYVVTYTSAQLNGQSIDTWDSSNNPVTPTKPLTMILAYYCNSTALSSSVGPLRTIIVGSEGYYMQGNLSNKSVFKIEILP